MGKEFSRWFDDNSGYALHKPRKRSLPDCCAQSLEETERVIYLPVPQNKEPLRCRLFVCARCKRMYAKVAQDFVEIDNLLKYRTASE
ncbi:hypothetical protein V6615_11170 [Oscillospiraceae bacterium PP1C4]